MSRGPRPQSRGREAVRAPSRGRSPSWGKQGSRGPRNARSPSLGKKVKDTGAGGQALAGKGGRADEVLEAASLGDVLQLRALLRSGRPGLADAQDEHGWTGLHLAARYGHAQACRQLLLARAELCRGAGSAGVTALATACLGGHGEAARLLLDAASDPAVADTKGRNCLHVACVVQNTQVLRLILEKQPTIVNTLDREGRNALYYALGNRSLYHQLEALKLLLTTHCSPNQQDKSGQTPLCYATIAGSNQATGLLLCHGAYPVPPGAEPQDPSGALERRQCHGASHAIAYEPRHEPKIKTAGIATPTVRPSSPHGTAGSPNQRGQSSPARPTRPDAAALLQAALQQMPRGLVGEVKDANAVNDRGESLLYIAATRGLLQVLQLLLLAKADVDRAHAEDGTTALCAAAEGGQAEALKLLMEAHADVNVIDNSGATPCYAAAEQGRVQVLELLLEAHADVEQATLFKATPSFIAAQKGHAEALELLWAAKADLNAALDNGASPVYIAAQGGQLGVLELLLKARADLEQPIWNGTTPLHVAAQEGRAQALHTLLEAQAQVAAAADDGATALSLAAQEGRTEALEILLAFRADPDTRDALGISPARAAQLAGHGEAYKIILMAGGDMEPVAS